MQISKPKLDVNNEVRTQIFIKIILEDIGIKVFMIKSFVTGVYSFR